jgi:uridine phosphorylase
MIAESELIVTPEGAIYHLNLKPEMLAGKIILVGDPYRVERVAARFSSIHYQVSNREFRTITGDYKGHTVSVISTGIGTDNVDIVMNELDALVNIDLQKRELLPNHTHLKMLRLGTCGGVQENIPTGTFILSKYSVGSDGLMNFYEYNRHRQHTQLAEEFTAYMQNKLGGALPFIPFGTGMNPKWADQITHSYGNILQGINFTGNGFYGPQGRSTGRVGVKLDGLERHLREFSFDGLPILNIEMETSGIYGMAEALGHEAASISVILANRSAKKFHPNIGVLIEELIDIGLDLIIEPDAGK